MGLEIFCSCSDGDWQTGQENLLTPHQMPSLRPGLGSHEDPLTMAGPGFTEVETHTVGLSCHWSLNSCKSRNIKRHFGVMENNWKLKPHIANSFFFSINLLLDFSSSISQHFSSTLHCQPRFPIVAFSLCKQNASSASLALVLGSLLPLYSVNYCFECH